MALHIYSNYSLPNFKPEYNSYIKLTVPDLSLTVGEIIERAMAGDIEFPMMMEDSDGNVYDISKSDLTEMFPNANFGFDEDYEEIAAPVPQQATQSTANPPSAEQTAAPSTENS